MKQGKMDPLFEVEASPKKKKLPQPSLDKSIDNLAGAICDPIIVHRCGWGTKDMIPEWLRQRITMDRLIALMVANKEGREPMGTDSEALAYLIPASMEAPMGHDWSQIYLYLGTKVIDSETSKETKMPADVRVEKLDQGQEDDLLRLKRWLYQTKAKHRTEKARDLRREKKEKEKEEKAALGTQTSYFDF